MKTKLYKIEIRRERMPIIEAIEEFFDKLRGIRREYISGVHRSLYMGESGNITHDNPTRVQFRKDILETLEKTPLTWDYYSKHKLVLDLT